MDCSVSSKLVMVKAKYFYESECDESEKSLFVASNGWVNNFLRPNGRKKNSKCYVAKQQHNKILNG